MDIEARIPLLEEILASKEATSNVVPRIVAHATYIDMAWGLNDAALASAHADILFQLAERTGPPWLTAYCLTFEGIAQLVRGDYGLAITILNKAW